ncbi:hypothetical protein Tco_0213025 [Tanacetum coccineum]
MVGVIFSRKRALGASTHPTSLGLRGQVLVLVTAAWSDDYEYYTTDDMSFKMCDMASITCATLLACLMEDVSWVGKMRNSSLDERSMISLVNERASAEAPRLCACATHRRLGSGRKMGYTIKSPSLMCYVGLRIIRNQTLCNTVEGGGDEYDFLDFFEVYKTSSLERAEWCTKLLCTENNKWIERRRDNTIYAGSGNGV